MLYGWFTRIMNRPKKVNAVALEKIIICLDKLLMMIYNIHICGLYEIHITKEGLL
jgi:hypothetical protein